MDTETKDLTAEKHEEEHLSKKQKTEEKAFGPGFYTKNFGPDSEVYSLIKQAKDKINQIYVDNADDLEDCECTSEEMAKMENELPGMMANHLDEMLKSLDKDLRLIDRLLKKHLDEKTK